MANDLNQCNFIGRLVRDLETRTFPSGDQVANGTLAVGSKWKDRNTGESKESTEWVRLVFHGKTAEIATTYLGKGSQIYVTGEMRTREYEQDGVKKYSTEIRVNNFQMLGAKPDGGGYAPAPRPQQRQAPAPRPAPAMDFPANPSYRAAPRSAPPPQSGGSGFDDLDGGGIPFRDPLSYRGAHLVL